MKERLKLKGKLASAYAAGIIDGEGTITITKLKDKSVRARHRFQFVVRFGMTYEWIPRWFQFNWGGYVRCQEDKRNEHWRPQWIWVIQGPAAKRFLLEIQSYLILKRPQAELALKFQDGKLGKGHRLSDEQRAVEEAQRLVMAGLNRKGR